MDIKLNKLQIHQNINVLYRVTLKGVKNFSNE